MLWKKKESNLGGVMEHVQGTTKMGTRHDLSWIPELSLGRWFQKR